MAVPLMKTPLCLVENSAANPLVIREDTLDILTNIDQPVVVVAISGPYRTGKSFLMNRLFGKNRGFPLGSTVQSKTKGIWVWCHPHPTKSNHCLIILDTEGLYDVEKEGDASDKWIFVLSLLLSSTFVYNNMATINNEDITRLHYVAKLTELIKVSNASGAQDGTDLMEYFPCFIWTVRDFTLELVTEDGKPITADEYLDMAFKLKRGRNQKIMDYNAPRECIMRYFREKKCFPFPPPTEHTRDSKFLETLPEARLDGDFLEQARQFRDYVIKQCPVKTIDGKVLTGRMLASILRTYVDTIKCGRIPCLENAFEALSRSHNEHAVTKALEVYRQVHDLVALPTDSVAELSDMHQACEREAVSIFLHNSFDDKNTKHQEKLKRQIAQEYAVLIEQNMDASRKKCLQILDRVTADVQQKLKTGAYIKPNGYVEYQADIEAAIAGYSAANGKGLMTAEVLQNYLTQQEEEAGRILSADEALSFEDKKLAEQRTLTERERRKADVEEQAARHAQQLERDEKVANELHLQQLREKNMHEKERLIKDSKLILQQKLKNQEELLKHGFREKAEQEKKAISELEKKISSLEQVQGYIGKAETVLNSVSMLCMLNPASRGLAIAKTAGTVLVAGASVAIGAAKAYYTLQE